MAVWWIFVIALGSLVIGGMLRSRGEAILDDPRGFLDRRPGHLVRPFRRHEPVGGRGQAPDSPADDDHRRPEAANDPGDSQLAGGGEIDGEWSLLTIPICVCAILLFVSAIGGLPGS